VYHRLKFLSKSNSLAFDVMSNLLIVSVASLGLRLLDESAQKYEIPRGQIRHW